MADELTALRAASLWRERRVLDAPGRPRTTLREGGGDVTAVINFSSNDYLGLAGDPRLAERLVESVQTHGAGAAASRLVCGTQAAHVELEETLAWFKSTEAALVFGSGYAAAVGTLGALLRRGDVVILDKLAHASLVDGARLSGATLRVFAHNDVAQLERRLAWAAGVVPPDGRVLVATESVFSMDGDRAPLADIAEAAHRHGALLLVDEAHGFGVLGRDGRGLADELGVASRINLHLGTLSKAVGLSGGYVAASRETIDLLYHRARSFVYSTAPPPAVAAAASWVIRELFAHEEGARRRSRLWENIRRLHAALATPTDSPPASAIVPVLIGDEAHAVRIAERLRERGFLAPAIRYPTVARGAARLRITLSAAHTEEQIDDLARALHDVRAAYAGGHDA